MLTGTPSPECCGAETTRSGLDFKFLQCGLAGWLDYDYYCSPAKVLSNCQTGDQAAPVFFFFTGAWRGRRARLRSPAATPCP